MRFSNAKSRFCNLKLPGDYKNFLKRSNGLSETGYSPKLSSIEEVCSLKIAYKDHEEIFEIIKGYPGGKYAQNNNDTIAEYVERAIAISRVSESEVWLIPPIRKNDEWQCWYFHTGEHRFRNFRYFIEHLVQMYEDCKLDFILRSLIIFVKRGIKDEHNNNWRRNNRLKQRLLFIETRTPNNDH